MKVQHFLEKKNNQEKITMITCYDYWSAKLINESDIDAILVGDSLAMVMHGESSTIPTTVSMMKTHLKTVMKGAPDKFIIVDLPFLSYRQGIDQAMSVVQELIQAGAHAVKMEGVVGNEALIRHIVDSGVPVIGHLGLTLQMFHQIGGHKVQGRTNEQRETLIEQSLAMQEAGACAIVLECVTYSVAKKITQVLSIPTIGIGAGACTDGQIMVLHDVLGFLPNFKPKFAKQYLNGAEFIMQAINSYVYEVKHHDFPTVEHHFD